jgi:hypothetical protein
MEMEGRWGNRIEVMMGKMMAMRRRRYCSMIYSEDDVYGDGEKH